MNDLIKALQILIKYGNPEYPTICEHDVMIICGINPDDVTEEDKKELNILSFEVNNEYGEPLFSSYRFGSA